jgi:glycosyltransferase involved in cell wall biosynthesis
MRIHFSNVNFGSRTGPNTFAHRLASELSTRGFEIVDDRDYDSCLVFIEPSSRIIPGKRVIQRLDGIWFKPEEFETKNRLIKQTYDSADHIVWQSNFDKNMTTRHWGDRTGTVINNGIALNGKRRDAGLDDLRKKYDTIFVTSANWHRQKRLKETIQLFLGFLERGVNGFLIVMGSNPDSSLNHPRIGYTGSLSHDTCLGIYSNADWMIHLGWLDHCPNVVVEALSVGCPVICTDSGGTHEIVKNSGLVIPESFKYDFQLLDYDQPPGLNLDVSLPPRPDVDNSHLDIKLVADAYAKVIIG